MVARRYCPLMQAPPSRRCAIPSALPAPLGGARAPCPQRDARRRRAHRARDRGRRPRGRDGLRHGGGARAPGPHAVGRRRLRHVVGIAHGRLRRRRRDRRRRAGPRGRLHEGVRELHAARALAGRLARVPHGRRAAHGRRRSPSPGVPSCTCSPPASATAPCARSGRSRSPRTRWRRSGRAWRSRSGRARPSPTAGRSTPTAG